MLQLGRFALFALVFGIAATAGAFPAAAQILILSSDVQSLPVKKELAAGDSLDIPDKKSVRVLLPSGGTRLIRGPWKGLVSDLAKGEGRADAIWQRVKVFFAGQDTSFYAADRGPTFPLDWLSIPVPPKFKGAICVSNDGHPAFIRLKTPNPNERGMKIYLGDSPSGKPIEVTWDKTNNVVPWPASLNLLDGGRYFVVPDFGPAGTVTVRVVDKASLGDEQVLNVLQDNGCHDQFSAWLRQRLQNP
jgi:hypothetical protein